MKSGTHTKCTMKTRDTYSFLVSKKPIQTLTLNHTDGNQFSIILELISWSAGDGKRFRLELKALNSILISMI